MPIIFLKDVQEITNSVHLCGKGLELGMEMETFHVISFSSICNLFTVFILFFVFNVTGVCMYCGIMDCFIFVFIFSVKKELMNAN